LKLVLSDLHLDTWDQTRLELFLDFLNQKQKAYEELFILGDILDLPPEREHDAFSGKIVPRALQALLEFSRSVPIHYLIGNHDLGINGLRGNEQFQNGWLPKIRFAYPQMTLKTPQGMILMEHGHFYDPALLLYIGDWFQESFGKAMTPDSRLSAVNILTRKMQWRDPETALSYQEEKEIKENLWQQVKKAQPQRSAQSITDDFIKKIWRKAAQKLLQQYNGEKHDPQAYAVIFGHTHRPDSAITPDGRYFNSGDWKEHHTYLEIDRQGEITSLEWPGKSAPEAKIKIKTGRKQ